jgi:hypothetical protein
LRGQIPDSTEIRKTINSACDSPQVRTVTDEEWDKLEVRQDSIRLRMQFVEDSLRVREQFVRDSIARRKQILDSVTVLGAELHKLLEAYVRSVRDELIIRCRDIPIVGDSALGNFEYITLPFGVRDPYSPWRTKIGLSGKAVKITRDSRTGKVTSIHTPQLNASYNPGGVPVLILKQPVAIQKNWAGNFYKVPLDSVFYDRSGRIVKIKSYVLFYALVNNTQQGNLLFTNRTFVRQFVYGEEKEISVLQVVRYCERWKAYEVNKVCSIISYTINKKGETYLLSRKNEPPNVYSDGTYTFNFDLNENLNGISFSNLANTENWHRVVELNSDGYVSCYMDKTNNIVIQSLCMIYHKEAGAKYAVETITTTFEKDGISYLQKNNTTGKMRTRDRMTLEWSPWK